MKYRNIRYFNLKKNLDHGKNKPKYPYYMYRRRCYWLTQVKNAANAFHLEIKLIGIFKRPNKHDYN